MASKDRLNMLIRNYTKRFPNATVDDMGTYLRRNHPEEYKLWKRIGDVKQNIVTPKNNIIPTQKGNVTRIPKAGPDVTYNPEVQPKVTNPVTKRLQLPAVPDITDYTKGNTNTGTTKPTTKPTSRIGNNLKGGGVALGLLGAIPAVQGALDTTKDPINRSLDALQALGGVTAPLMFAPHPVARGIGYTGLAASMGLPVIRGMMNREEEVPNVVETPQVETPIQQPTNTNTNTYVPTPQLERVTAPQQVTPQITPIGNAYTDYEVPTVSINNPVPLQGDDYYNRANIMSQELGAATRGAAQNFNQIRAELTPEQLEAYANLFNLRNQQQEAQADDLARLQQAQEQDTRANNINEFVNSIFPKSNGSSGLPVNLTFRDFQGNAIGTYNTQGNTPRVYGRPTAQSTNRATEQAKAQIALSQLAREQELANAQEMAKLQDAIALSNATGMPIAQSLGMAGKDILDYNKNVVDAQTDLLGRGIEGTYDINKEAMGQTGTLQQEAYKQTAQNARTEAELQNALTRDKINNAAYMNRMLQQQQAALILNQMNNEAAMNRVMQQGRNAMSLAEYKARTGSTQGYEDYMRAMISATSNPLMPEEYSMAIWDEAMKRQGIRPAGYSNGGTIADL